MSKLIKFVRDNKIVVFALAVIVLTFGLLAIPGFSRDVLVGDSFKYYLSGYETFFNTRYTAAAVLETKVFKGVLGAGIAAFVMLILSFVGLLFSKKSSFVMALTGLSLVTVAFLFLTMEPSVRNILTHYPYEDNFVCGCITYIIGALLLIAGGLVIYKTVLRMKDEIKHPSKAQGPSYNYLKK